jgi:hypothetical protein
MVARDNLLRARAGQRPQQVRQILPERFNSLGHTQCSLHRVLFANE